MLRLMPLHFTNLFSELQAMCIPNRGADYAYNIGLSQPRFLTFLRPPAWQSIQPNENVVMRRKVVQIQSDGNKRGVIRAQISC